MSADLSAAVTAAISAAVRDVLERGASLERAITRAVMEFAPEAALIERPAEKRSRENADAMAQMDELETSGKGRSAAALVARRLAIDPDDPAEVEMLAQRLRRLRRVKKSEQCSFRRQTND